MLNRSYNYCRKLEKSYAEERQKMFAWFYISHSHRWENEKIFPLTIIQIATVCPSEFRSLKLCQNSHISGRTKNTVMGLLNCIKFLQIVHILPGFFLLPSLKLKGSFVAMNIRK